MQHILPILLSARSNEGLEGQCECVLFENYSETLSLSESLMVYYGDECVCIAMLAALLHAASAQQLSAVCLRISQGDVIVR